MSVRYTNDLLPLVSRRAWWLENSTNRSAAQMSQTRIHDLKGKVLLPTTFYDLG